MISELKKSIDTSPLRAEYLRSLTEPQEYFVELMVQQGITLTCENSTYAIVHNDTLVELYSSEIGSTRGVSLLHQLLDERHITTVLCKSFDTQLLNAALSRKATVSTAAYLFRRMETVPSPSIAIGTEFRKGTLEDVEAVMGFNDGFFESADELIGYFNDDGLFVLELDGEIVACGIGTSVIVGERDIDIGVLVSENHRRRGLGHILVHAVKEHYQRLGCRPICGCSVNNLSSKRTLEKAGFISEHRLFSIGYH